MSAADWCKEVMEQTSKSNNKEELIKLITRRIGQLNNNLLNNLKNLILNFISSYNNLSQIFSNTSSSSSSFSSQIYTLENDLNSKLSSLFSLPTIKEILLCSPYIDFFNFIPKNFIFSYSSSLSSTSTSSLPHYEVSSLLQPKGEKLYSTAYSNQPHNSSSIAYQLPSSSSTILSTSLPSTSSASTSVSTSSSSLTQVVSKSLIKKFSAGDSLSSFIQRSFMNCKDEVETMVMSKKIEKMIKQMKANGIDLNQHDWEKENISLPPSVSAASSAGSASTTSTTSSISTADDISTLFSSIPPSTSLSSTVTQDTNILPIGRNPNRKQRWGVQPEETKVLNSLPTSTSISSPPTYTPQTLNVPSESSSSKQITPQVVAPLFDFSQFVSQNIPKPSPPPAIFSYSLPSQPSLASSQPALQSATYSHYQPAPSSTSVVTSPSTITILDENPLFYEDTKKEIFKEKKLTRKEKKEAKEKERKRFLTLEDEENLLSNDKKNKRSNRFLSPSNASLTLQEDTSATNNKINKQFTFSTSASSSNFNDEEFDLDSLKVIGTCQRLEKEYFRLTSPPHPSTVRPLEVLRKSLDFILEKWNKVQDQISSSSNISGTSTNTSTNSSTNSSNSSFPKDLLLEKDPEEKEKLVDYLYMCSQLKSIRQDLTIQHIKNEFTIHVYETHARIALQCQDLNEYNQCQTQLKQLYNSVEPRVDSKEFLAYRILYYLYLIEFKNYDHGNVGLNILLQEMSTNKDYQDIISSYSSQSSPSSSPYYCIIHALQLHQALIADNLLKALQLYHITPNLGHCLLDLMLPRIRFRLLSKHCKAMKPEVDANYILKLLSFRKEEKERKKDFEFLKKCQCKFKLVYHKDEDNQDEKKRRQIEDFTNRLNQSNLEEFLRLISMNKFKEYDLLINTKDTVLDSSCLVDPDKRLL